MRNLLDHFLRNEPAGFQWMNKPPACVEANGSLCVVPPPRSDFYCASDGSRSGHGAGFLYARVTGDFVARVRVRPDLSDTWNAAGVMAYVDGGNWARLGFERTDGGRAAVVSVVTRDGASDDANGPFREEEGLWLQLLRRGCVFSMHWSPDGESFERVRLFRLNAPFMLSLGLIAQCPCAQSARHRFDYLSVAERTPADLRAGA